MRIRFISNLRRRLAVDGHIEGVEEATDKLVEADGDDEVGELVRGEKFEGVGLVDGVLGQQPIRPPQDRRFLLWQPIDQARGGGVDRGLTESGQAADSLVVVDLVRRRVGVADTDDRQLAPVWRERVGLQDRAPNASKPGARPGECMIIRYTLSEP